MNRKILHAVILSIAMSVFPFTGQAQLSNDALAPPFAPQYFWGASVGFDAGYYTGLTVSSHPFLSAQNYPSQIALGYSAGIFAEYPVPVLGRVGTVLRWSDYRATFDYIPVLWTERQVDTAEGMRRAVVHMSLPSIDIYSVSFLYRSGLSRHKLWLHYGLSLGIPVGSYYEEVKVNDAITIPGMVPYTDTGGAVLRTEEQNLVLPVQWSVFGGIHYDFKLSSWSVKVGESEPGVTERSRIVIRSSLSFHYGLSNMKSNSFHYLRYGIGIVVPLGWGYKSHESIFGDY